MRNISVIPPVAALLLGSCVSSHYPRSANPSVADGQQAHGSPRPQGVIWDVSAPITAALGVGAAAKSRSEGGCFTPCVKGTACNKKTGFCDELPCRGECSAHQRCDKSGIVDRCVDDGSSFDVRAVSQRPDGGGD